MIFQWRLAWLLTGISLMLLTENTGFILYGVCLCILEVAVLDRTKSGVRYKKLHPSLWYGAWWFCFPLAIASRGYTDAALVVLAGLAISGVVLVRADHHYRRFRGRKH